MFESSVNIHRFFSNTKVSDNYEYIDEHFLNKFRTNPIIMDLADKIFTVTVFQSFTVKDKLSIFLICIFLQAIHNLDQQEYAIKKVPLTGTRSKRDKVKKRTYPFICVKYLMNL